jgi:hypothetical protein
MVTWESIGNPKILELDYRGQNIRIEEFFISLENIEV